MSPPEQKRETTPPTASDRGGVSRLRIAGFVARAITGDQEARIVVIEHYAYLVGTTVSRMGIPGDSEEQIAAGNIALCTALDSYRPDRKAAFRTWAMIKIRNAVRDQARKDDRVGRTTRRRLRSLAEAEVALLKAFGRSPSVEELAEAMLLPAETVEAAFAIERRTHLLSLDFPVFWEEDGPLVESLVGEDDTHGAVERRMGVEEIAAAIAALPPREAVVIRGFYFEDLTLAAIARREGMSEAWVFAHRHAALGKMRVFLDAISGEGAASWED